MSARRKPARWRKVRPSALSRNETRQLWRGDDRLMTVARYHDGQWYFYGRANGRTINTLSDPIDGVSTWPLIEAQERAAAWVRMVEADDLERDTQE